MPTRPENTKHEAFVTAHDFTVNQASDKAFVAPKAADHLSGRCGKVLHWVGLAMTLLIWVIYCALGLLAIAEHSSTPTGSTEFVVLVGAQLCRAIL